MSAKLTIECKHCGYIFELYSVNLSSIEEEIKCPKCFTMMDSTMSTRVFNTLLEVKGLSTSFKKYASERNEPEFNLSFETIDYLMDNDDID